jgi:hypothetical protein
MAGTAMITAVLPPAYSLVQVVERLPLKARRKYDDLKALLADSEALQRSLMERMKAAEERLARISRQSSHGNDGELTAVRVDLDKLERERSKRNSVRANTEQVVSRLNNFLMERASGVSDVSYPPRLTSVPVGRRKGESTTDAILRVRREISAATGELMRIKSAPLPKEEVQLALIQEVDRMASGGTPQVSVEAGRVTINWPDIQMYASPGSALSAPSGSASKMLAWLFRKELIKKLIAEVEDNEDGIPSADRPRLICEAEARIFGLEIVEEKLVMAALDAGLEVHRRIDASPWAILGYGAEEAVPAETAE